MRRIAIITCSYFLFSLQIFASNPVLIWGTFYGGSGQDLGYDIATDGSGNIYMTGRTGSTTAISTAGAHQEIFGGSFVVKFNSSGIRQWGTYYNGSGSGITTDSSGNVYVTGQTTSATGIATAGAHQEIFGGTPNDAFVVKFNSSGVRQWGTYYGGSGNDIGNSITTDSSGNVYVTGITTSASGISTVGAHQEILGAASGNGFIVKFNSSGQRQWGTYYNGSGSGITTDSSGNVYITGGTSIATGIATAGAHQEIYGFNIDAFIVKFNSSGVRLWGTFYGGSGQDLGYDIATDGSGNIYMTGGTGSTTAISTAGAHQGIYGGGFDDVFIVKFNSSGVRQWGTYYGGSGDENMEGGIATDNNGDVYVTGRTESPTAISTAGTHQEIYGGGRDAFIVKFNSNGQRQWGTYYGGFLEDQGSGLATDASGNVYVTGFTESATAISTAGAHQEIYGGGGDAYVTMFSGGGSSSLLSLVQGTLFADINTNCINDTSDFSIPNMLVKAEPGPYYGLSDTAGNYIVYVPDTGSYTVSIATRDTIWQQTCTTTYNVQLSTTDTVSGIDFAMTAAYYCPRLTVDIGGIPRLRRCRNNNYTIQYRNTGTLHASNAHIEVDFGDYFQPQSSTIPWTTVSGNIYTFPIGNLNSNQQGSFRVNALLDCATLLWSTQCVTAHIYPDSICIPPSNGWDKSETKVTGTCVNDSLVCFTIKNRSSPPSGNMQGPAQWRLYMNDTLITQGIYQLSGQDSIIKCDPSNGKTYRLEADQRLGHPGNSHPKAIIEACGNDRPIDFGFITTVPHDDADLFVETFCIEVSGSWDPNDKQVSPAGITSRKYITSEDELEFLINFQNTGNDTAFKVIIRDTIDTDVLDIATLTSGASSDPNTFNIYDHGVAEWTFNNILLPDSNVNEPESHGFVKFKVRQKQGNPDGTRIENRAAIYFDFNEPVITNAAWVEVNEAAMPVDTSGVNSIKQLRNTLVEYFPNPAQDFIKIKAANIEGEITLYLYDSMGRLLWSKVTQGGTLQQGINIDLNDLPEGIFFLNVETQFGNKVFKVVKY